VLTAIGHHLRLAAGIIRIRVLRGSIGAAQHPGEQGHGGIDYVSRCGRALVRSDESDANKVLATRTTLEFASFDVRS
jgi:hypothetical protein